jgi:D-alanine-D-alanine ligase
LFVKPSRLGSSIGITKVRDQREIVPAIDEAFRYDTKVLVEEYVPGREIECSVLGNREPKASVPGEVVPQHGHEFYDYAAKYTDENGALLLAPAELDAATARRIQETAIRSFLLLGCSGMARVDFFLTPENALVVNELNSIPGFTDISMYPRLWALSGVSYPELIEKLIRLALERSQEEEALETDYYAREQRGQ